MNENILRNKLRSTLFLTLLLVACQDPVPSVNQLSIEFGSCLGDIETPRSCAQNLLGALLPGEVGCWIIRERPAQIAGGLREFRARMLWDGQEMSLSQQINASDFPFTAGDRVDMSLFVFDSETTAIVCDQIELERECNGVAGCWTKLSRDEVSLSFNEVLSFRDQQGLCSLEKPLSVGAELCDEIDNDCDSVVDEGCEAGECSPGETDVCDLGCGEGISVCNNNNNWECRAKTLEPERCDNLDNDCDGKADEGVENRCGECGPEPDEECDGEDNDCDNTVDEGAVGCCLAGEERSCGIDVGSCTVGIQLCNGIGVWGSCSGVAQQFEVCDGLDNDCDGRPDENLLNACGICGEPPAERCDGVDNDCDGRADEGVLNACGVCGAVPAESCDGADNDCDGRVDEGVLNACGMCGAVPAESCDGADNDCDGRADEGVLNACGVCGAVPAETCDGADNDCDGRVDENLVSNVEVCDGVDNDCDGLVDEGSVCGTLVKERCVARLGWAFLEADPVLVNMHHWPPVATAPTGMNFCPESSEVNADTYSCDQTGTMATFRAIELNSPIDQVRNVGVGQHENNWLGLSWDCRLEGGDSGVQSRLLTWVRDHCHIALAFKGEDSSTPIQDLAFEEDCGHLSAFPGVVERPSARCIQTQTLGKYSALELGGIVDEEDQFGLAFYCEESASADRPLGVAERIQEEFQVFFALSQKDDPSMDSPNLFALDQLPEHDVDSGNRERGVGSSETDGADGFVRQFSVERELNANHQFYIYTRVRPPSN